MLKQTEQCEKLSCGSDSPGLLRLTQGLLHGLEMGRTERQRVVLYVHALIGSRKISSGSGLLENVCVTGVTRVKKIHRAAVTDTFLAQVDLQTQSPPRFPLLALPGSSLHFLPPSQMLSLAQSGALLLLNPHTFNGLSVRRRVRHRAKTKTHSN